ncbi:sodium:calcium antiporter [Desulfosarcina alkanivorans]|uniref:Sodium:calcium antiporter n=1 Tax=Desulfosarcina alkanivorans TaxID=571177 RepID=A0A5K7YJW8_9BACT|nr:calcium/sodium antiporter [Desulfosarcina alkanivorans]BBO68450.1 sodium:calcium antiporter [Desulfosarcina alkanivorans]
MTISHLIAFTAGLLLLYYGAGWLVRGASTLARSLGLSPMVIGLTVVAFGTSAPELVVSLVSAVKGKSMIALGNVVGSNICNIALVLGLTAVFQPVKTSRIVITRDIPLMLAISAYLLLLSFNSVIGRIEGVTLFGGILAYTWFNYKVAVRVSRAMPGLVGEAAIVPPTNAGLMQKTWMQCLMIVGGTAGVVVGADLLVDAAVSVMSVLGVNEKFVGLTVVAFGTSVPELATSVVAAMKKEMDISLGNLVGSNVFNLLSVVGATAMVRPIAIAGGFVGSGLVVDYLVMMTISALPWVMMRGDLTISRRKGLILIGCYVAYVIFLIFKS